MPSNGLNAKRQMIQTSTPNNKYKKKDIKDINAKLNATAKVKMKQQ
jgi:hypothetical protein